MIFKLLKPTILRILKGLILSLTERHSELYKDLLAEGDTLKKTIILNGMTNVMNACDVAHKLYKKLND